MKIALVVPYHYYQDGRENLPSGLLVYTRGLAQALVELGHQVWILCSGLDPFETYSFEGSTVVQLGGSYQDWTDLRFSEVVHAWLNGHPMDVVEAHQWQAPLLIEQLLGGTPCVVRNASGLLDMTQVGRFSTDDLPAEWADATSRQFAWSRHMMEVLSIKNADLVFAAGQKAAMSAEAMGGSRIVTLPLGIPSIPEKVPKGQGVLVSVSRFEDRRKGGEFVLPLLARIPEDMPVTVLGKATAAERKGLLDMAPREAIWITEPVSAEALDQLYRNHEVVIVTSKSESFGLCFLEPISYGKPVIAFTQSDPSKRDWPMWTMGEPGIAALDRIPDALGLLKKWKPKESRAFAKAFVWKRLAPLYVEHYEQAMANALSRGKTRGW